MNRLIMILLSIGILGCAEENGNPNTNYIPESNPIKEGFNFQQLKDPLLFSKIQESHTSSISNTYFTSIENSRTSNFFTLDGKTYSFPYVYCYSLGGISEENIDISTSYDTYLGISIPIKDIYSYTGEVLALSVEIHQNNDRQSRTSFGRLYLSNGDVEPLNVYDAYNPTIKIEGNRIEIEGDFIEDRIDVNVRDVNPTNIKTYYGEGSLTCNLEIDF